MFSFQRGQLVIRCVNWCVEGLLVKTRRSKDLTRRWVIRQAQIAGAKCEGSSAGRRLESAFKCAEIYMRMEPLELTLILNTPSLFSFFFWGSHIWSQDFSCTCYCCCFISTLQNTSSAFSSERTPHLITSENKCELTHGLEKNKNSQVSWIINTSPYFFHLKKKHRGLK